MEYRTLNNGMSLPMLGLGTWDLKGDECTRTVQLALEMGYQLLDCATMYGNQKEVGQGIRHSNIPREKIFITSKICRPDNTYQATKTATYRTLQQLQTDYLDLLLIHEPYPQSQEMYQAMLELMDSGVVKAIGVSNFNDTFYRNFIQHCHIVPMVNQVESHVYYPQIAFKNYLATHGTVMQAWAPFTEGRRNIFSEPILQEVASHHHKTTAQIALRYLLQQGIAAVPKSSSEEHLRQNLEALDFQLDPQEIRLIQSLDQQRSLFAWYE